MAGLQSHIANTIPLPGQALVRMVHAGGAPDLPVSRDDRFSKAKIVKYFPNLSYGFVRDGIGRELFFHIDEIDLVGPKGRKTHIRVGADVGYDCCRTSHGLRVKRMKIY